MTDVLVIGGGVIGLSIAHELAGADAAVTLLDKGELGREASWAGAGMLPPGNPDRATTAEALLRAHSAARWPQLSSELFYQTGIDNGFRNCGSIEVRSSGAPDQLQAEVDVWREEGVAVEELSPDEALALEPALNPGIVAVYRLPEASQVRNPHHLRALETACAQRGVRLAPGVPVTGFDFHNNRVTGVRTPTGTRTANAFCIAGGAWSQGLLDQLGVALNIEPVRGQIVLLSHTPLPFRHLLHQHARYLVPRPDGRILVGSTEERVGFDKRTTAHAVAELIAFGIGLVRVLAAATVERTWAGLRPCAPDGLPYIGRLPEWDNVFIAAGHFRSGLQMSPATAILARQLILGEEPIVPPELYACHRHSVHGVRTM